MLVSRCWQPARRPTYIWQISLAASLRSRGDRHLSSFINYAAQDNVQRGPAVAIIGSGPAGFYTAQKLLREIDGTKIDMYEQLPVPFGLVRFGVAPDHPEVKNCQDSFDEVAESPDFTFIGNVQLGREIPLTLLADHYDAVVFAYGASKDRQLGLEGENKPHIYSARAFVGWYNGLPEYRHLDPDLTAGETAIIVGQGNVALDVARTLLSRIEVLQTTDITDHALQALKKSTIKHVHVVGRRGPMQAAFTIKELRELIQLEDVNFVPVPDHLFPANISKLPRPKKRLMELLKKGSSEKPNATKTWSLDFLLAPNQLKWSEHDPEKLEGITFNKTVLAEPDAPESKVSSTDETFTIPTSTLFRSIGYKSEAILGMADIGIDFNEQRGVIRHDGYGRIVPLGAETSANHGAALYCSGWVKRGPTGVIASTMTDAFETAESIVEDWTKNANSIEPRDGWEGVQTDLAVRSIEINPVYWNRWQNIDRVEKLDGEAKGKPREKLGTIKEMLRAAQTS